jgi:hypothetical protein
MIAFGIMSLTMESEENYLTEIAQLAENQGMEVFRFIPSHINPNSETVKGKKYVTERQDWIDSEFPIPAIIYDRCFYGEDEHSKQCLPIVTWLKSRADIQFLGYGLPNKLELYHSLRASRVSAYLPQSKPATDAGTVLKELHSLNRIILKPINGAQGYGIYYVRKNEKTFHVKTEKQKQIISRIFPNELKLKAWLDSLLTRHEYLVQPYLELSNEEMKPQDIRILLQKNEHGKWLVRGNGVRQGNTGGILSNLSAGGTVTNFAEWMKTIPSSKRAYILSELEYIITNLPQLLEKEFLPLFEIGIDIGVAKDGSLWILDVNSKPGRKVVLQTKPEMKETLYLAPLLYGKYLMEADPKERKNIYERTLSH